MYDSEKIQQQMREAQEQLNDLALIQEFLKPDVIKSLDALQDATRRHPTLLDRGFVIYGRQMPEITCQQQPKPSDVQQLREKKRRETVRKNAGALRRVIEAFAAEYRENGISSAEFTHNFISSESVMRRVDCKLIDEGAFESGIRYAVRAEFLVRDELVPDRFRLTAKGWQRVEAYKVLDAGRVRVNKRDEIGQAAAEIPSPAEQTEQADAEVLLPISENEINMLLPATVDELDKTLSDSGYDTSELKLILHSMRDARLIHRDDGIWKRGKRPEKIPAIFPDDSRVDPDNVTRKDVNDLSKEWGEFFGTHPEHRELFMAIPDARHIADKDLEKKCGKFTKKGLAYFRGKKMIYSPQRDTTQLTPFGRALHEAVLNAYANPTRR